MSVLAQFNTIPSWLTTIPHVHAPCTERWRVDDEAGFPDLRQARPDRWRWVILSSREAIFDDVARTSYRALRQALGPRHVAFWPEGSISRAELRDRLGLYPIDGLLYVGHGTAHTWSAYGGWTATDIGLTLRECKFLASLSCFGATFAERARAMGNIDASFGTIGAASYCEIREAGMRLNPLNTTEYMKLD